MSLGCVVKLGDELTFQQSTYVRSSRIITRRLRLEVEGTQGATGRSNPRDGAPPKRGVHYEGASLGSCIDYPPSESIDIC